MKVGILGSGDVGKDLAKAFKAEGNEVMIATRDTSSSKANNLRNELGLEVGNFEQTAQFGELLVLCTRWNGTMEAIDAAGVDNLSGKVLMDITNPADFGNGELQLQVERNDSAGQQIQRKLPNAKVVKTLNMIKSTHMYHPSYQHGEPSMFMCGNDEMAKQQVRDILHTFGWDVIDMGPIDNAQDLEALALFWIKYGTIHNSWDHAFKILTS